jgi:hypothetical protein
MSVSKYIYAKRERITMVVKLFDDSDAFRYFEKFHRISAQYEHLFNNSFIESFSKISNMLNSLTPKIPFLESMEYINTISGISKQQLQIYDSLGIAALKNFPVENMFDSLVIQWDAIAKALSIYQTPQIIDFTRSFNSLGLADSLNNFVQ